MVLKHCPCALQALQFYGLDHENKWAQLGYEATFFALFFFLAWCAGYPLSLQYQKWMTRSPSTSHAPESFSCPPRCAVHFHKSVFILYSQALLLRPQVGTGIQEGTEPLSSARCGAGVGVHGGELLLLAWSCGAPAVVAGSAGTVSAQCCPAAGQQRFLRRGFGLS